MTTADWFGIVAGVHIGAVVAAIGGTAFVLFILRPVVLGTMPPPDAMRVMAAIQMRFRWVIWASISVLVVTGLYLASEFHGIRSFGDLWNGSFAKTLTIKSLLSLVLFGGALSVTLPLPWLAWFRQRQPVVMRTNLILAATIVVLASLMIRSGGVF